MAENDIQGIFVGLVIFSLFTMAGFGLMFSSVNIDNTLSSSEITVYNNTFNAYSNTYSKVGGLETTITSTNSSGVGSSVLTDNIIVASWNILKSVPSMLNFAKEIIWNIPSTFGYLQVPTWVGGILIMLLILTIVFAILAAIFNRKI